MSGNVNQSHYAQDQVDYSHSWKVYAAHKGTQTEAQNQITSRITPSNAVDNKSNSWTQTSIDSIEKTSKSHSNWSSFTSK